MLCHRSPATLEELIEDLDPDGTIRSGWRVAAASVSPSPLPPMTDRTIRRAKAYLAKLPPSVEGCGGSGALYAAARAMVYGFNLDHDVALGLILAEYNTRAVPPWSQREIEHKLQDANAKAFGKARGWLLEGGVA